MLMASFGGIFLSGSHAKLGVLKREQAPVVYGNDSSSVFEGYVSRSGCIYRSPASGVLRWLDFFVSQLSRRRRGSPGRFGYDAPFTKSPPMRAGFSQNLNALVRLKSVGSSPTAATKSRIGCSRCVIECAQRTIARTGRP